MKIFLNIRKSESWRFEISSKYRRASSMMNKHARELFFFFRWLRVHVQPEGEIRFSVDVPALYSFAVVYNAAVSYPIALAHIVVHLTMQTQRTTS